MELKKYQKSLEKAVDKARTMIYNSLEKKAEQYYSVLTCLQTRTAWSILEAVFCRKVRREDIGCGWVLSALYFYALIFYA